jgi:two-component system, OmpR family, alkaline phosphatase synthesis response regulator PhoP
MKPPETILIFDDDEDILGLCHIILSQKTYIVKTFFNVINILERTREIKPDIIFIDNGIPDIGGSTAVRLLKSEEDLKHIPVIYFSAQYDIAVMAHAAGADAYLQKPFDIKDMEDIIEMHLQSRTV